MAKAIDNVREHILHDAISNVTGKRLQDYGTPEDNFGMIADFWARYLGVPVSASDVANMMILLKVARASGPHPTRDTFVDIAGYAACAGELELTKKPANNDVGVILSAVCGCSTAEGEIYGKSYSPVDE